MKVTQQSEPKFIPVVITLETQEEVDILYDLVGRVNGSGAARKLAGNLYYTLKELTDIYAGKYFDGGLTSKAY